MANSEDYALVVGINDYRALDSLSGAKNDAEAFASWLRDPKGGDLPEGNVKLILSTSAPLAPGLEPIVDWLIDLVEAKSPALDTRIGRRFYLFLAGHGIGPSVDEAGLLVSTTATIAPKYIAGSRYANFFRAAALFEEVLLFMDCCRDHDWELPEAFFPFRDRPDPAVAHKVRILYAFATGFGRKSRERSFDGDEETVGGVFTRALLQGLECRAASANGEITAEGLKRYVTSMVEELRLPGTDQRPEVRILEDFVLRQGCPPPQQEVVVELTPPARELVVLDAGAGLSPAPNPSREVEPGKWAIDLIPGRIYIFRGMDGANLVRETGHEVTDRGDNHVRL